REREELLSVRAMLEGHAVSRIAPVEPRRESLLAALAPVLAAQEAATGRPTEFAVHDYAFHLALASHDGNRVVEEVLRGLGSRLFRLTHLAVLSPAADLPALHREHVELTDAVARGDVTGFREMIDRHLRTGHDSYPVVAEGGARGSRPGSPSPRPASSWPGAGTVSRPCCTCTRPSAAMRPGRRTCCWGCTWWG